MANAYDTGNHLTSLTDHLTYARGFTYGTGGRIASVTRADNTTEALTAVELASLVAGGCVWADRFSAPFCRTKSRYAGTNQGDAGIEGASRYAHPAASPSASASPAPAGWCSP